MNPSFEQTCHLFGALSCQSASFTQCMAMAMTAAAVVIAAVWSAGRLAVAISA